MRVLYVTGTLDPAWGGPVEGLRNLVEAGTARGVTSHIVCTDHATAPWLQGWGNRVSATGHLGTSVGALREYGYSPGLDQWLLQNLRQFDLVVVNGIWLYFSYAVWKATRQVSVPYYVFVHGALDPWFKETYPVKHLKKIVYWSAFEHKVFRDAEAVLFTTEEERTLAQDAFQPYKCFQQVTGFGIKSPVEIGELRSGRNVFEDQLKGRGYILFLSRIHRKKGLDVALKAFASAKAQLPNTAFVVAGPGDAALSASLQDLARSLGIEGDVLWVGPLYNDAKWQAIRGAELYVLSSHQENFGVSVVEALACGIPVAISNKVNIWRDIESENAGLVAPDDVPGTTQMLQTWSKLSPAQKAEMSVNARRCFERHFDLQVTSDQFFSLLNKHADVGVAVAGGRPA